MDHGSKIQSAQTTVPQRPPTTVDVAYRYVQSAIMGGELAPGMRIPQDAIASELGVSRMPLREALHKLEERGFVRIHPHRGVFVTEPNLTDIRSTYFVRTALESASAAEAARAMDAERVRALRSVLDEARGALAAGDSERLAALNAAFHMTGHMATGNQVLCRVLEDLTMHCRRYRLLHAAMADRAAVALHEHEEILRAWAAHDATAASHWVELNLRNSEAALIAALTCDQT